MSTAKYAQVVLGLPLDKAFTYSIPKNLEKSLKIGQRVEMPFGQRMKIGYIVNFLNQSAIKGIKPLKSVLDQEPILDRQMLQLTRQVADYYCAGWGEVIEAAVPANIRKRKRPLQAINSLDVEHAQHLDTFENQHTLTAQQRKAVNLITKDIQTKKHQVFLLHGITASGKTEVYLQAIASCLSYGRSSIVLVPEIALTPQTVERFKSRFGQRVALMHSRLSASERSKQWQLIRSGRAQIVIGARSAVFSPVKDLGLIVIDEEHETTYKQQDSSPHYHARQVAMMRAKLARAVVVLGSATPSLEAFYNAKKKNYKLLSLPERVTKRDLPHVDIIDMRKEIIDRKRRGSIFSRALEAKIEEILRKKEQAILFLNRRGFSTFVSCSQCGYAVKCKRCNVSLTYHYASKSLICHYCNFKLKPPKICPQCNSGYLRYFGLGTEKVESELHRLFPHARIGRMDSDVTTARDAHSQILRAFKNGEIDILVGTQMIAKGLDFPRVNLVGVVSADTALNLPDFRSGERTFNLLTQVAGRAGRGEEEGKVVIQTYVPQHYAIDASISHNYYQFYRREIKSRQDLNLPPFTHLVNLTLRGRDSKKVQEAASDLATAFKKEKKTRAVEILGPAPDMVSRIRGNYRWNIMLKGREQKKLGKLLKDVLWNCNRYRGQTLIVDVDPI